MHCCVPGTRFPHPVQCQAFLISRISLLRFWAPRNVFQCLDPKGWIPGTARVSSRKRTTCGVLGSQRLDSGLGMPKVGFRAQRGFYRARGSLAGSWDAKGWIPGTARVLSRRGSLAGSWDAKGWISGTARVLSRKRITCGVLGCQRWDCFPDYCVPDCCLPDYCVPDCCLPDYRLPDYRVPRLARQGGWRGKAGLVLAEWIGSGKVDCGKWIGSGRMDWLGAR